MSTLEINPAQEKDHVRRLIADLQDIREEHQGKLAQVPESRAAYRTRRSGTLRDGSMSEKAFAQQVVDFARLNGWMVYRTWNSLHSPSGFPDCVFCLPAEAPSHWGPPCMDKYKTLQTLHSRIVVAELKSLKGQPTPEQVAWLAALRAAGVPTYLWRPTPEDWAEIERVLGGDFNA